VRIQLGQGTAAHVASQVIKNEGIGGLYKVWFFFFLRSLILPSYLTNGITYIFCLYLSVFVLSVREFMASISNPNVDL
jgi:hypothetical protein